MHRRQRYRQHLQAAVANSAAPYGYTLTIWTSGAVTTDANGLPSSWEAVLFLAGAVIGFGLAGTLAYGGIVVGVVSTGEPEIRLWGNFHLPSVGAAIALATLVAHTVHSPLTWPIVSFLATFTYLTVVAAQFTIAAERRDT